MFLIRFSIKMLNNSTINTEKWEATKHMEIGKHHYPVQE